MSTKTKAPPRKKPSNPSCMVWFEIPADNVGRARKFYSGLFGWKIKQFAGMKDYWHIDVGGADRTRNGGLMARKHPGQPITNYISVASVTKSMAKVKKLGGCVCLPKTAVPKMGYFAICCDTEDNTFALWEMDEGAK